MSGGGRVDGFFPLNDLEGLLVRAASDPGRRAAFGRAVLDSQLYAVTPQDTAPPGERISAGEAVQLVMAPLPGGEAATVAFTAPERIAQIHGGGTPYLGLRGRDLIALVAEQPLWLNPGLEFGVVWRPEDLAALLGRPMERTVERDTRVMLGSPAEHPHDLVDRLGRAFSPEPGIEAAWLALAQWPGSGEWAWYLDVRTGLPRERVRDLLARAMDGADGRGLVLDMAVNPPGGPEGTGIPIVKRG